MKVHEILKEGSYTFYARRAYEKILGGLKDNNVAVEIRLDHDYHGVCIFASGVYADIEEDEQGVRIEWLIPLTTGPEVTHIKDEVIDL